MAKVTFHQKLERVLRLLLGLRHAEVRAALLPYGLTDELVEKNWERLNVAGTTRLRAFPTRELDSDHDRSSAFEELRSFQDHWFPVARAVLLANFPKIGAALSLAFVRERRSAIPFAVRAFLDRLGELESDPMYGADGPSARLLLEQRGLTKAATDAARRAIDRWAKAPGPPRDEADAIRQEEEAAAALWAFYLEWSSLSVRSITSATHLRWLGLAPSRPKRLPASDEPKASPPLALPSGPAQKA